MMCKWIGAGILTMSLFGCATGICLAQKTKAEGSATTVNGGVNVAKPESKLDHVKVYKADGSLQCGQGKAIPAAEMQKDLKSIQVYSSATKNDGMMRIQVCGAATGNANVYEIDRKDLAAALKMGFKEWTFDT
jgi:hypothetical protein